MKNLEIRLRFLKNPLKSTPYLLIVMLFLIGVVYAVKPALTDKLFALNFWQIFKIFLLPEFVSFCVFLCVLNWYHRIFRIRNIEVTIQSITAYQFKVLPIHLVAYGFFYPCASLVRYAIRSYPNPEMKGYVLYMKQHMIIESYFLYLPIVLILGYTLLNVSLIQDFLWQYQGEENEVAENNMVASKPIKKKPLYLDVIQAKGISGNAFLRVGDCYYFTTSDHSAHIHHAEGIFRINQTIAILEKQLNPKAFFKISPGCIINLAFLEGYTYCNNGKYALHLKEPLAGMTTTKQRMKELRVVLKARRLEGVD